MGLPAPVAAPSSPARSDAQCPIESRSRTPRLKHSGTIGLLNRRLLRQEAALGQVRLSPTRLGRSALL